MMGMSKQGAFMIYCAEQYQVGKAPAGQKQLAELFSKYQIWEYVYTCYRALSITGAKYIVNDIDLYIEARKPVII